MSSKGVLGAMWADREGYLDTTGTVHAYARAARKRGAEYYENTKVEELVQTADGSEVITTKGTITCGHCGQRGGSLGQTGWPDGWYRIAGFPRSNTTTSFRDSMPELENLDFEVPMTVDLEGFTYMRQAEKGILLGIYEVDHEHWAMDGAPG